MLAIAMCGTLGFHATHLGQSHTFFNAIAGGPDNGWRHLSFSNVDWGQSTYRMVDWVKGHPEQRPMTVLFRSGLGDPSSLLPDLDDGFSDTSWRGRSGGLRAPQQPGWFLVSSFQMTQKRNEFFRRQTPVAQPWSDVLLFYHPGTASD